MIALDSGLWNLICCGMLARWSKLYEEDLSSVTKVLTQDSLPAVAMVEKLSRHAANLMRYARAVLSMYKTPAAYLMKLDSFVLGVEHARTQALLDSREGILARSA